MSIKPDENNNESNNFDNYDMSYLDYYDTSDTYISNYNQASSKDEINYNQVSDKDEIKYNQASNEDEIEYSNYNQVSNNEIDYSNLNKDEIDYGYGNQKVEKVSSQEKAKQNLNKETTKNIKKLKSKVNKTGKKKRKLKKDIKTKIIFAVILLIIGLGVALYFNTDIFRTKREVFIKYFDQTFEATKILENESNNEYNEKKITSKYKRVGNAKIISSSNVADSKALDKLKFSIGERTDNENEKSAILINVMNGMEILEEINLLKDGDNYGFYCKDVANSYIFIKNGEMKKILNCAGIEDTSKVPNYIKDINLKYLVETTDIEKDHINKILDIMKNNVPNNAYNKDGKVKLNIDGTDYDTNAYSLTLGSNDSATLYTDVLEKITKDSILINYFASKAKLLGMEEEYTDINKLNEYFQKEINSLHADPSKAKELKIVVYENRMKNIRTDISFGDSKIIIDHINKDDVETSIFKINEYSFKMSKNKSNTYTYEIKKDKTAKSEEFSLTIELNQTGTVEDNNIRNKATINLKNGIKNLTLEYNDTVNFTDEIGTILSVDNTSHIIVNNSNDKQIKEFINELKKKINSIYIKKGTDLGINLDPLFK